MENTQNYLIDYSLINDIECEHNNKKRTYNKFCLTCKKNICSWCKGHENHEKINLDSIEPDEKKYDEFDNKMSNMKLIGEIIEKKYTEIIQIQKYIKELNDIINDVYKKLKKFNSEFESHLKFNEIIFNSYKEDKRNYYILCTFNSLDFNLESDYLNKDLNFKKINNFINKINIGNENIIDEKCMNNMWISEKYCKNWGLKQAIREFIQNQYDGIITKIKSKKELKILEFDFIKNDDNKILGKIRYNKSKKILSISNIGELSLADFLLGGSKEEQNNPNLIGVFGEGMKLAILALCRLDKNVTIISSNNIYNFAIKADQNFIKNNEPQKCLHCKIDKNYNELKF